MCPILQNPVLWQGGIPEFYSSSVSFVHCFCKSQRCFQKGEAQNKKRIKKEEWISRGEVELSTEIEILSSQTQIQDSGAQAVHQVTCQNSKELFNKLTYW